MESKDWNQVILDFPDYSFFHSREWAEVLVKTYDFEPRYFCSIIDSKIQAIVPTMIIYSWLTGNRLVSLPFSDYCTPLFKNKDLHNEFFESILNCCKSKKLKFIEFKSLSSAFPPFISEFRNDYIHTLKIDLPEIQLINSFSDNTKRNIKKASKAGVKLIIKNDDEGVSEFYKMNCITRQKHGLPPQPYVFFKNILTSVINNGFGDIILAYSQNSVIAGDIFFKFGKKIIYKYGASYPAYHDLRGSHFVMWEAIKKYSSEGYKDFDFGRTELNHDGLRRFKQGWNTTESFIYTSRINSEKRILSTKTKTNGFYNKFFNRTPIFILKLVGGILYKHIA